MTHGCLTPEHVRVSEYGRCDIAISGFGADSSGSGGGGGGGGGGRGGGCGGGGGGGGGPAPGTRPFRAPEALLGLETGAKTDLWCAQLQCSQPASQLHATCD
jgi:hypothetical protein